MDVRNDEGVRVLMFPWLAQGHASPFLELAKKLSRKNFYIYFCSTPIILNSIKPQITEPDSLFIRLVELHLPSLPDLPPDHHTTKGLPSHLIPLLIKSFHTAAPIFVDILKTLNPDLVIYDGFQPWAPAAASSHNIPAVFFSTSGAATTSLILHIAKSPDVAYPFPEICLQDFWWMKLKGDEVDPSDENEKGLEGILENFRRSCDIILVKTFREIEAKYIDYLSVLSERKVVPVGPLFEDGEDDGRFRAEIFEWLNKKDINQGSVVFVAFGSECFLHKDDIEEIAHGLELSKIHFLWALNSLNKLPEGFVGERGMVVEGWVPQKKILGHSSIGGFVSHCGWSSVVESLKFGVPIIAMPMHLDQPVNAKLVESIGVGVEVKRDGNGKLVRGEIAKVIGDMVINRRRGEDVRRKAKELSEGIMMKGEIEITAVAEELLQLCLNKKH